MFLVKATVNNTAIALAACSRLIIIVGWRKFFSFRYVRTCDLVYGTTSTSILLGCISPALSCRLPVLRVRYCGFYSTTVRCRLWYYCTYVVFKKSYFRLRSIIWHHSSGDNLKQPLSLSLLVLSKQYRNCWHCLLINYYSLLALLINYYSSITYRIS